MGDLSINRLLEADNLYYSNHTANSPLCGEGNVPLCQFPVFTCSAAHWLETTETVEGLKYISYNNLSLSVKLNNFSGDTEFILCDKNYSKNVC